jgi:multidrug resistance efflux pump
MRQYRVLPLFVLGFWCASTATSLAVAAPDIRTDSTALLADEESPAESGAKSAADSSDSDKEKTDKKSDAAATDAKPKADESSTKDKAAEKAASDEAKKDDKDKDAAAKDGAAKTDDKAAKPEKRKIHKVEPKRLKIDLALEGTFAASKMTEVPLRPDAWSDYEIVDVAELGAKVHKGQVLFKFDSEKINDAIGDLELEQRLNELAIVRSEEDMPRLEKTLKMDFEDADRGDREAKQDFKRYNEIDRPLTVKAVEFMLKSSTFNLDYETDELEQLEKMYKADDLTEDTEEIVLKRQRNSVEFAKFRLETAKHNTDEMLNIQLPRLDIQMKEALERVAIAKARAQMALSLDLNRARYELEQRKKARTKSLERHTKLLADRELMELKSPADGVVYYGQCVNGRWADTASLVNKYKPHNNVSGGSILMTIVEPRPLYVTSTLDEGKRPEVSDGQKVKVALPSEGDDRLAGKVKSISPLPVGAGKFEINFDVEQDEIPDWIAAGMSCKVNITTYDKADAIVVPKKAVHDDENDPDIHYVWLVESDDPSAKPERRDVKLGKRKGEEVEIVKGLKKGDIISLDDEEAEKKEKEKAE